MSNSPDYTYLDVTIACKLPKDLQDRSDKDLLAYLFTNLRNKKITVDGVEYIIDDVIDLY